MRIKTKLSKDGRKIIYPNDFCFTEELEFMSKEVFKTKLSKSFISLFSNGVRKNIHISNLFKFCVLLGCAPNDLLDWKRWEKKVAKHYKKGKKVTNEQISKML